MIIQAHFCGYGSVTYRTTNPTKLYQLEQNTQEWIKDFLAATWPQGKSYHFCQVNLEKREIAVYE